ncbi:phosphoglycerate dehydrogenase-like enzyme [Kutzneria buriramensis]|uniref:Phosphoglycerate dehydrogenase-like enzyme n=1 Tax=Kutzneria buriramensis TaxID=1045776 RepID=A0A3E0H7K2_9PSEU|nr:phosphoglycerate dehydrogenase-like enzyme [Kutzneria buriramensis]
MLAVGPHVRDQVFPPEVRAKLAGLVDARTVDDFGPGAALAAAEVVVTGWGGPALDATAVALAPRLRLVVHTGGSVKEARIAPEVWERGVAVSSAAAINAVPVAQYTVAAILLAGKRAFRLAADFRVGAFRHAPPGLGTGNAGRTVGVVGASRIGRLVLAQLRDHGFRLLVSDPYLTPSAARELGADLVELDELLAASDVVTLHAPLLEQTRRLLDDRRLGLLRDGAVLVNTARGGLVDTEALVRHCGRIDAVLDVTDPEPLPPGHPLLRLPNVFVTPHVAGALGTETRRLGEFAVAEIGRWLAGFPLDGAVRAEDLARSA